MMKTLLVLLLALLYYDYLQAQKAVITDTSYLSWTKVANGEMSANGRYVLYNVISKRENAINTIIRSTDLKWQRTLPNITFPRFSNEEEYLFGLVNRKLIQLKLGTKTLDSLAETEMYWMRTVGKQEYLIYHITGKGLLVINAIGKSKIDTIADVESIWVEENGTRLVLKKKRIHDSCETLVIYDLYDHQYRTFYTGNDVGDVIFDNHRTSIAFVSLQNGEKSIWLYSVLSNQVRKLFSQDTLKPFILSTNQFWQFSPSSNRLYFGGDESGKKYKQNTDEPDVWNYQDRIVYPYFKKNGFNLAEFKRQHQLFSVELGDHKITQLTSKIEKIVSQVNGKLDDYFVVQTLDTFSCTSLSAQQEIKSYYLVYPNLNKRMPLKEGTVNSLTNFHFSPDKKYIIYFDEDSNSWTCFHILTGRKNTFGETIKDDLAPYQINLRQTRNGTLGIASWIKGTYRVVIQGENHLWEVSINNRSKPVDLTYVNHEKPIKFSFCEDLWQKQIDPNTDQFVCGIDQVTRSLGLYRLNIAKRQFVFVYGGKYSWNIQHGSVSRQFFQKAEGTEAFLFCSGNVSETPNYHFTRDFKSITPLSDFYPERSYNWLSSELLSYSDSLGNICHGILYKPDNFDESKKYPIIFDIYQDQSYLLNRYISPEPVGANINIPLMVSNGYLVFKPDVYMKQGESGRYILMSIIAAADYFAGFRWVDESRLGITGHSLGGGEVNYIVSKTNRFRAALAGAGISSMINDFNDLWHKGTGFDKQGYVINAYGMSGRLENSVEEYLDFSPILHTKNINTPLLLFHNEDDLNVDFYHSTQLFLQLRSMGKPVWLLNYNGESHFLIEEKNKLDYQAKAKSYFDHFLKGRVIPDWMSKHIKSY